MDAVAEAPAAERDIISLRELAVIVSRAPRNVQRSLTKKIAGLHQAKLNDCGGNGLFFSRAKARRFIDLCAAKDAGKSNQRTGDRKAK